MTKPTLETPKVKEWARKTATVEVPQHEMCGPVLVQHRGLSIDAAFHQPLGW
jgi:hypothetical protein